VRAKARNVAILTANATIFFERGLHGFSRILSAQIRVIREIRVQKRRHKELKSEPDFLERFL